MIWRMLILQRTLIQRLTDTTEDADTEELVIWRMMLICAADTEDAETTENTGDTFFLFQRQFLLLLRSTGSSKTLRQLINNFCILSPLL